MSFVKRILLTAAEFTAQNPTLDPFTEGLETDTLKYKIGDGSTVWTSLLYADPLGLGQTGNPLANSALQSALGVTSAGLASGGGTVGGATISAGETINPVHKTLLTLASLPVSLSQTHVGGGSKIYTFPEGRILIHGAFATITPKTTSAILTTLNGSKTLSTGVGTVQTVAQDSGTLATTEQDIVNAFSTTSSATINVAGTVGSGSGPSAPASYDGHTTPIDVYLNFGVPTASDIDGAATITASGVVQIIWSLIGDF